MGKSSTAVNHWMRDRGRFADLFNGVVFDGEQVVRVPGYCHAVEEGPLFGHAGL